MYIALSQNDKYFIHRHFSWFLRFYLKISRLAKKLDPHLFEIMAFIAFWKNSNKNMICDQNEWETA